MVIAAVAGYMLGSIPAAVLVGRFFRIDPRSKGDGNPGWWNMRHLLGNRAAFWVLLVDVSKGALAAGVGLAVWGPWWTAYVAVAFAMLGHAFPVFAQFRGGRSVLTFTGGMAVLAPLPVTIAIVAGAVVGIAGQRFAYGGRVAMFLFPVVQAGFDPRARVLFTGVLMTFIGFRFLTARSPAPATSSQGAELSA